MDRPFQPSDWVDLTLDTALYHTKTPILSSTNLKDNTPIPPPRRKKHNHTRSLTTKSNEPIYSSINRKTKNNYVKKKTDIDERKRTRDIYQHKVNGNGKIISCQIVSGWKSAERLSSHQKSPKIHNNRPKNVSTVSLPNYDELIVSENEIIDNEQDNSMDNGLQYITSPRKIIQINGINGDNKIVGSLDITESSKFETSTPIKEDCKEVLRIPVKVDGWFLHPDR